MGDTPGELVESNVFTDLNPANQMADTSWIHPGKASWDWWDGDLGADGKPAYTTENMEYYVDFAAQSGFPYMMLDAGWSGKDILKMRGNVDVPELVQYASKKKCEGMDLAVLEIGRGSDEGGLSTVPRNGEWPA